MERIVIEVSSSVAKAWRKTTEIERRKLSNEVGVRLGIELLKNSKQEYIEYIDQLQQTMKERGLTQEKLDELLNES